METLKMKWYPLYGSQECSKRLGYGDEHKDSKDVCCQAVYDIAWEAEQQMLRKWNEWGQAKRNPHYFEFTAIYQNKKINPPFLECPGLKEIVDEAKKKIIEFYKEHLKRAPSENELVGSFMNCDTEPDFEYDYSLEFGTGESREKNYEQRNRPFSVEFVQKVEISKCVVCGKPVFVYNELEMLHDAGDIQISFGYGSGRDMDTGKGYIHDICSGVLDEILFKQRLNWNDPRIPPLKIEFDYGKVK